MNCNTGPHPSVRFTLWLTRDEWKHAVKAHDTIVTVLVFDPAVRLLLPAVVRLGISANQVTAVRLAIALIGAGCYIAGHSVVGAMSFLLWYYLDCIDGKVARLTHCSSAFGDWFDRITDRLGVGAMLFSLGCWQLLAGHQQTAMWAFGAICVWYLRCMNSDRLGWILATESRSSSPADIPTTKPGRLDTLRYMSKWFTSRTRIIGTLVHDVEWLLLSLVIGPLTGTIQTSLAIAVVGMSAQFLLHVFTFWYRRLPPT